jgi:hypothetical protein
MNEKDTHRKLLELFYEYVKANLKWESKETHLQGKRTRKILSQIQKAAATRRDEIQAVRAEKPRINYPLTRKKPDLDKDSDTDD